MIEFLQQFSQLDDETKKLCCFAVFFLLLMMGGVLIGIHSLIEKYIETLNGNKKD